jgi:hypothetical protein
MAEPGAHDRDGIGADRGAEGRQQQIGGRTQRRPPERTKANVRSHAISV